MRRRLFLAALGAVSVTAGAAWVVEREPRGSTIGTASLGASVISNETQPALLPGEPGLKIRAGTRKAVGRFSLRGGRALQVRTLETTDGMSCLVEVEEPSLVGGSTCRNGGLFDEHKVVFSVNSDGGPERFTDEYLIGIAAPEVALVALERSDGSVDETRPNAHGAFVIQSSPRDLERDALPAALRAYARDGSLVEAHEIPSPR